MTVTNELQTTLGAIEIGIFIGITLTGVQLLQAYHYFRDFLRDPWKLKVIIITVSILDVAHTLLLVQSLYHWTIVDFGYIGLDAFPVSYWFSYIIESLVILLAQSFFIYRIYTMSGSIFITAICASLNATRFAFAVELVREAYAIHTILGPVTWRRWQFIVYASISAVNDTLSTVVLCTTFARNRSGVERTDKLLDQLIAYTISSGLLTSLVTLSSLICYLTMDSLAWLAIVSTISKFFGNSLLASLNARTRMRIGYADDQYQANSTPRSCSCSCSCHNGNGYADHQTIPTPQVDNSKINV